MTPTLAAGQKLRIRIDQGQEIDADIVRLPFYDPQGERQRSSPGESAAHAAGRRASLVTARRRNPLETWCRSAVSARLDPAGARLRFENLSRRERFGCKGPGAEAWLTATGFAVPPAPNSAQVDAGGVLVARLGLAEFLVEAVDGGAERVESARRQLGSALRAARVYPVARADLVIGIGGAHLNLLLRQICSVDFAPGLESCAADFGPVTLTSMIGVGVVAFIRGGAER